MSSSRRRVVFLPGGVTPVGLSYAPLLEVLADEVEPVLKDLEVYAGDRPPTDYSIALEADAVVRLADAEGLDRFDLVAFSGGGAVALSFAARHPERLRSLAMFEPANVPGQWEERERAYHLEIIEGTKGLPPDEMLSEFTRLQVREGVELPVPPPGPAPEWMAKRPAGLAAMMEAFGADDVERDRLRDCRAPVYLAYGNLTGDYMRHRVAILSTLLPDVWIEMFVGVHHFGPPQRTRPAEYARSLRELWGRSDRIAASRQGSAGDSTYAA